MHTYTRSYTLYPCMLTCFVNPSKQDPHDGVLIYTYTWSWYARSTCRHVKELKRAEKPHRGKKESHATSSQGQPEKAGVLVLLIIRCNVPHHVKAVKLKNCTWRISFFVFVFVFISYVLRARYVLKRFRVKDVRFRFDSWKIDSFSRRIGILNQFFAIRFLLKPILNR